MNRFKIFVISTISFLAIPQVLGADFRQANPLWGDSQTGPAGWGDIQRKHYLVIDKNENPLDGIHRSNGSNTSPSNTHGGRPSGTDTESDLLDEYNNLHKGRDHGEYHSLTKEELEALFGKNTYLTLEGDRAVINGWIPRGCTQFFRIETLRINTDEGETLAFIVQEKKGQGNTRPGKDCIEEIKRKKKHGQCIGNECEDIHFDQLANSHYQIPSDDELKIALANWVGRAKDPRKSFHFDYQVNDDGELIHRSAAEMRAERVAAHEAAVAKEIKKLHSIVDTCATSSPNESMNALDRLLELGKMTVNEYVKQLVNLKLKQLKAIQIAAQEARLRSELRELEEAAIAVCEDDTRNHHSYAVACANTLTTISQSWTKVENKVLEDYESSMKVLNLARKVDGLTSKERTRLSNYKKDLKFAGLGYMAENANSMNQYKFLSAYQEVAIESEKETYNACRRNDIDACTNAVQSMKALEYLPQVAQQSITAEASLKQRLQQMMMNGGMQTYNNPMSYSNFPMGYNNPITMNNMYSNSIMGPQMQIPTPGNGAVPWMSGAQSGLSGNGFM